MNSYHSAPVYLSRWLTPLLKQAAKEHPIIVLTGARQVGKSTLLRYEKPFATWKYYTLDEIDVLRQAEQDPKALWAGVQHVVIDEVQKVPALLPAIKQAVDQARGELRFVLSGSANLLLMRHISESLAGRAVYFTLQPLTYGETQAQAAPQFLTDLLAGKLPTSMKVKAAVPPPLALSLLRGGMPSLLSLSGPEAWVQWWEGYVATYLERDLRQISQVSSLPDFHRVMELLALRTGQLINQSDVARDAQISQPSIHRYLNLLETTHLFQRLPAYTSSRTTRLLKAPKVQWADAGLAVFLAGYYSETSLLQARELGNFFETYVVQHLKVLAELLTPKARLFYWRTIAGKEVDVVIEQGQRLVAIEIKMSEQVGFGDVEPLRVFLAEHPKTAFGVILYRGTELKQLAEKIVALPLAEILGMRA